jgi:hypothetical protein
MERMRSGAYPNRTTRRFFRVCRNFGSRTTYFETHWYCAASLNQETLL